MEIYSGHTLVNVSRCNRNWQGTTG